MSVPLGPGYESATALRRPCASRPAYAASCARSPSSSRVGTCGRLVWRRPAHRENPDFALSKSCGNMASTPCSLLLLTARSSVRAGCRCQHCAGLISFTPNPRPDATQDFSPESISKTYRSDFCRPFLSSGVGGGWEAASYAFHAITACSSVPPMFLAQLNPHDVQAISSQPGMGSFSHQSLGAPQLGQACLLIGPPVSAAGGGLPQRQCVVGVLSRPTAHSVAS